MDAKQIAEKLSYAKVVMLGESSHGTHEFYEWRREISQELISKYGFNFISVEGDWPPCAEMHELITNENSTPTVEKLIQSFQRWPTWMWANIETLKLLQWLREFNYASERKQKQFIGFHGLDVYSLFESMDEVIKTLKKIDPALAEEAKKQYACFDRFERDERRYAQSLYFSPGCEQEVLRVLQKVLFSPQLSQYRGLVFDLEQNARIVKNAEDYYRTMIHGNDDSWNVRDRHMMETLDILLYKYGADSKGIVWAHNTHIGDYKATPMKEMGQINIGGLAREEYGAQHVALLGFGTYQGQVIASHAWDGPIEMMPVPPGRPDSYEDHFHKICLGGNKPHHFVWFKDDTESPIYHERKGHRAIGVVYDPRYERFGNYVPTILSERYDGFVFIDKTTALTPLSQKFDRKEIPETWPGGF